MGKGDNRTESLTRRHYAQLLTGVGAAGLAGCPSGSGGEEPTETGTRATAEPTDTEPVGGQGDTETAAETATPEGEPVTDTIRFAVDNSAEEFNYNPWQTGANAGELAAFMDELRAGQYVETQEMAYSGTTFDAPWVRGRDEIEVATWFTGYDVEPPHDVYEYHDDRLTYWDDTPLDAEARLEHERVQWFSDGNKFADGETFNHEAPSQWEYHWWYDKGEVEGQEANPTNRSVLEVEAAPSSGDVAMHPSFTAQYVEAYEDASTAEAVQGVTDELSGHRITLTDMAENGWGSGLYRLESADDVASDAVTLRLRDDHPNAEHANVPNLRMLFANADRHQVLASQGQIDVDGNIVQDEGGQYNRKMLPDHIQELARWLQLGGDKLLFNWNNPHLARLWVRRALVAAVDWRAAGENGWGAERTIPIEHQTGLLDAVNEREFSAEFLDGLHTWPMGPDEETARTYLERAGYTQENGNWVGPEGNPLEIDLTATTGIQDYIGAAQTVQANLQNLGVGVNYVGQGWSTWQNSMDAIENGGLNYDTTVFWHGQQAAWQYYWTQGGPGTEPLLGGDPNDDTGEYEVDPDDGPDRTRDTHDEQGKPLQVQIPEEPGVVEAPDEAGPNPDIGGEEIDLARIVHRLRDPIDEEEYQDLIEQCARYYNYYLPDFVFHQYPWGALGNARDFDWPASDSEAIRVQHDFGVEDYLVLGGIVQASRDEEYESP